MSNVIIVCDNDAQRFSKNLADIVNEKMIIDIKYETLAIPTAYQDGVPINFDIYDRALVVYTD